MPELPEVEHAARRLRTAALGRTIAAVATFHASAGRTLRPTDCRLLEGRRIVEIARRAKIQLISLDDGQMIEIHFRMTGDWEIGRTDEPAPPYERVRLACTDGTRISLIDTRAFAVVRRHDAGTFQLPPLGPEPLDDTFTPDALRHALATRRGPIKPVLLDQRVVAGLGNIYAAEALWVARIHPARAAASLSRARIARLHEAIRRVLREADGARYYVPRAPANTTKAKDAIDGAGNSVMAGNARIAGDIIDDIIDDISDDVGADISDDVIASSESWYVYDREGQPCTRCTRPIRRLIQAGRSTYYCPGCQK